MENSIVRLHISIKDLPRFDREFTLNGFCAVYENGCFISRTEVTKDSKSPDFTKEIPLKYSYSRNQEITIKVYNASSSEKSSSFGSESTWAKKHQFIGEVTFSLASLSVAKDRCLWLHVSHRRKETTMLKARLVSVTGSLVRSHFSLSIKDLPLKSSSLFRRSAKPYLVLYRSDGSGQTLIYRSEPTEDGKFKTFTLPFATLAQNGTSSLLRLVILDVKDKKQERTLASADIALCDLMCNNNEIDLEPKGLLIVDNYIESRDRTFVDYIDEGVKLKIGTAIDFSQMTKPYHIEEYGQSSVIEQVLKSVCPVVEGYAYEKQIGFYGYNARNKLNVFNIDEKREQLAGSYGLVAAYRDAVKHIDYGNPPLLANIMEHFIKKAKNGVGAAEYHLAIIISAGSNKDKTICVDRIVEASTLPLSFIFVGVGDGDMSVMKYLDGDDTQIKDHTGKAAESDCAQFIRWDKISGSESATTAQVLEELPRQIVDYFTRHPVD